MAIRRTKTFSGTGKVFDGAVFLVDVEYRIEVYQNFIEGTTSDGPYSIPGMEMMEGVITAKDRLDQHKIIAMDTPLTLHVKEGLQIDFFTPRGDQHALFTGAIRDKEGNPLD